MTEIAPQYRSREFIIFAICQPLWGFANIAVKLSIIDLYIKMFPSVTFHRVCYATTAVSICYFSSVFIETFALCKPVQYNWNKAIPGSCSEDLTTAYVVAGTMNLVIDVFVVAMPIPMLW